MWVRNFQQQIQDCMQNNPAWKFSRTKIPVQPPPPPVCVGVCVSVSVGVSVGVGVGVGLFAGFLCGTIRPSAASRSQALYLFACVPLSCPPF